MYNISTFFGGNWPPFYIWCMGKDLSGRKLLNPDAEHIAIDCFIASHFIHSLFNILYAQHDVRLKYSRGMAVSQCYIACLPLIQSLQARFKEERSYTLHPEDIKLGIEWFISTQEMKI